MRVLAGGVVITVLVAVAALGRDQLQLDSAWPLLVGLALALAPFPAGRTPLASLGLRLAAAVVGVLVGWVALAARMGLLAPDLAASEALVLGGALLILALLAIPVGTDAMWPAILGVALFHGVYEPTLAADPAGFLSTSPPAILSTLVVLAFGVAVGMLGRVAADLATGAGERGGRDDLEGGGHDRALAETSRET